MSKSYAQMADEILNGALTNPDKNPYDPAQGHQASLPSMDPKDTLVEMSDTQRAAFLKGTAGVKVEEIKEERREKKEEPTPPGWGAPSVTMELTPEDLETLAEAKRIITKIQEATTVGNIGVNFAGGEKSKKPQAVKLPGDTNVSKSPKKRRKKSEGTDFLAYLGGTR